MKVNIKKKKSRRRNLKNEIIILNKEKIEELKLEKREILIYVLICLVDSSYTIREMCGILGIGFQLYQVEKYCKTLIDKKLIKENGDKFIIIRRKK